MISLNTRKPLAAIVLLTGTLGAHAYDMASERYLLGDWAGLRSRLADRGISFDLTYAGEAAHNTSGGTERLTRYADQWAFGVTGDTNKLWGWEGGTLQLTMTDRNGRNLGADAQLGNSMLVQEIYGRSQTWHLTQFWLNQLLFDDRLQVKLGRLPVGEDFASFACDFQNLTFCGSQPGNIVGSYWVNWPTSQWALRMKYRVTANVYAQVGAYQVNPRYLEDEYARRNGWKLDNPAGTTGALIPFEFGWLPTFNGLAGSYKVGAWYNTSDAADLYYDINRNPRGLSGLEPLVRRGQYGIYASLQQQVTGTGDAAGATVFLNFARADRDTAALDSQVAAGVTYKGPLGRVHDSVGIAVGATHSNGRLADFVHQNNARTGQTGLVGDGNEYEAEAFYTWAPIASVYLRPNVQYIIHPGGTSINRNAVVLGLKLGASF